MVAIVSSGRWVKGVVQLNFQSTMMHQPKPNLICTRFRCGFLHYGHILIGIILAHHMFLLPYICFKQTWSDAKACSVSWSIVICKIVSIWVSDYDDTHHQHSKIPQTSNKLSTTRKMRYDIPEAIHHLILNITPLPPWPEGIIILLCSTNVTQIYIWLNLCSGS